MKRNPRHETVGTLLPTKYQCPFLSWMAQKGLGSVHILRHHPSSSSFSSNAQGWKVRKPLHTSKKKYAMTGNKAIRGWPLAMDAAPVTTTAAGPVEVAVGRVLVVNVLRLGGGNRGGSMPSGQCQWSS